MPLPATVGPADVALPPLREELRLLPAAAAIDGSPRWVIFDPLKHRYYQIGIEAFELLARWAAGSIESLIERAHAELGRRVSRTDVEALLRFVSANGLTREPIEGGWRALHAQAAAGRRSLASWLLSNYLFVRIPLVRPQRFLEATASLAAPFFQRWLLTLVACLGIAGLYLASRQWSSFTVTLTEFASFEGLVVYGVVLVAVKSLHELGHAYTAVRFGCRVPTMGLAFLVLYPMLYTDVSDAWRLREKRKRLLIDAGGVLVELMLAALATILWVFLPDGLARDVCFAVATTGWVLSLAVNLNPFMRFDGYYFLSDALGVENLGPRSFALARWWLRESLFAPGVRPPELFGKKLARILIAYALCTWIYRLVLFITIALLVYALFFKLLGVFLFVVEIAWFVARPVWDELRVWWNMRDTIVRTRRTWITGAAFLALLVLVLVPWRTSLVAPAVLQASVESALYPPDEGRLVDVHVVPGQTVTAGETLFRLRAPALEFERSQARSRARLIEERLSRRTADRRDLAQTMVLEGQLAQARESIAGYDDRLRELRIRAPFAGTVTDLGEGISLGAWVGRETLMGRLVAAPDTEIRVILPEEALSRVASGANAVFVPDDPQDVRRRARLARIDPAAQTVLESEYFSSLHGGRVEAQRDESGQHVPTRAAFGATFVPLGPGEPRSGASRSVRGVVRVDAEPESIAVGVWRRIAAVLVRESGF